MPSEIHRFCAKNRDARAPLPTGSNSNLSGAPWVLTRLRCGGEVKNARDQACEGYDFRGCREVLRDRALGRKLITVIRFFDA
jgi:hypothetical protein